MDPEKDYISINRGNWNSRVQSHVESAFYDMKSFRAGATSLREPELALLGELKGKTVLHLQCHFGQDSLSLARMGAKVTGADLSDKAIEQARQLAAELQQDAEFICCDLFDLPDHLHKQFDLVFTSYGTIGWLPDLDRWAQVVSHFLKPGGEFVMAEFHPVIWMFDNQFQSIMYRYFRSEAIVETENGSYANPSGEEQFTSVSWNHSLSEVIGALLRSGLQLQDFNEFDYSCWPCFPDLSEDEPRRYRFRQWQNLLPMMYSLKAIKKA